MNKQELRQWIIEFAKVPAYFEVIEAIDNRIESVISAAIAEHEENRDKSLDYFIDQVNYMRGLYQNGRFTKAEEIQAQLMNRLDDIKMLPLPTEKGCEE